MAYQSVFKRYELKYLLTRKQKKAVFQAMAPYMELDEYGRKTIRNIYFDTENYRLIRKSLEKPAYKEKLRIRSYSKVSSEDMVFVELKKKYDSVVYKRRMALEENQAMDWVLGKKPCVKQSQISKEIDYVLQYYRTLAPAVFLTYEREAFFEPDGGDFRVTFDENILCRQEAISLKADVWGTPLLAPGLTLMELKCSGGLPLWMVEVLSREQIYKTSFSKYGTAYQNIIFPKKRGDLKYA